MTRFTLFLLFILALQPMHAQTLDDTQWSRLEDWQTHAGPARMEVGVMQEGKITWYSVLKDTILINQPTELYYEIGSITKPLMGLALQKYLEEVPGDLETPVSEWLPDTLEWAGNGTDPIRLRHLVTHQSGMPRMPGNLQKSLRNPFDPFSNYQPSHLFSYLEAWEPARAPEEGFEYSNLAAGLATYAALLHSDLSLDSYTNQYLLQPLGLQEISYDIPDSLGILPYHTQGYKSVRWHFTETLAGAGAMRGTASGMGDLLQKLAAPSPENQAWISRSTASLSNSEVGTFCTFWIRDGIDGTDKSYIWHNGQTQGYETFLAWVEGEETGLVILSNRAAEKVTPLGMAWIQELGKTP
ncbi:MAG: serine hydrolase domain-containing protein [Bacteroidota bacterium]